MRLGQLARKLALRPTEIVEFLAQHHVQIEEGANTRLEEDHITLIMAQFAPDMEEAILEVAVDKKENEEVNDALPETSGIGSKNESLPDENSEEVSSVENEVEIIKAPKIALSGLKVLGKIDLPEPKKKEVQPELPPEDPGTLEAEKKPREEFKKQYDQKRQRPDQRLRKNPVALQREREAKEAQQKRQEQLEREKERRTQNYLKKVKLSAPTKAVRLVEEPVMEMSAQELAEAPRTWLGRFIKWLTTA